MYLMPTDCTEISNIINLLKVSSPGWDDISSKVVKSTSVLYLEPLVHIFNLSLQQGVFLSQFLDLSKAFDSVNHWILLHKLTKYGIRGTAHSWFKSYLLDRKQYVLYNNAHSEIRPVSCGVPQGSILGPLLFIIYINDMINATNKLFPLIFADDTNVFITGKNIENLVNEMNSEMTKLVEWLYVKSKKQSSI